MVAAPVPVLDTVTDCAAEVVLTLTVPKDTDVGDAETLGAAAATPVPEIAIGTLMPPLPVTVYVEANVPAVEGLNVRTMVQDVPAASDPLVQVPPIVKCVGAGG